MSAGARLDLHVHSRASPDSRLTLEAIAEQVGLAGLQGFALTDHQSVAGHGALLRLAERYPRSVFVPGVEVSAREGHALVYGVDAVPRRGIPLAELAEWCEARRGVLVLAHPLRWVHGAGRRAAERARLQGLETRNGRTAEMANATAELIAARRGLGATGGSDAHERSSVGRAVTELPEEVTSVEEVLEQLRAGRGTAVGRSLSAAGRISLWLHNGLRRSGRGLRPV